MTPFEESSPDESPKKPRRRRSGFVASEWEARVVPFVVTLGLIFFLLWFLGPIDLFGGKREAGKFFIALAVPIVGVAWLYDPITRKLGSRASSDSSSSSLGGKAPVGRLEQKASEERIRMRADGRADRSRAKRPFASHWATPIAYGIGVILLLRLLRMLIGALGLIRTYDGGALTYVLGVGGFLAAAFLYEPVISALDRRFGGEAS